MNKQISMLMDGELDDVAARSCLDRMRQNRNLIEVWALFHLIGDQLRAEPFFSRPHGFRCMGADGALHAAHAGYRVRSRP